MKQCRKQNDSRISDCLKNNSLGWFISVSSPDDSRYNKARGPLWDGASQASSTLLLASGRPEISRAVVLKLQQASESPGGLVKTSRAHSAQGF